MAQHHRYQLHDPRDDAKYHFYRAEQAVKKSEELGASQFQYSPREGEYVQIGKFGTGWNAFERGATNDGRVQGESLESIQAREDKAALADIEGRAQADAGRPGSDPRGRATEDAMALRRIQEQQAYERAQAVVAATASESPAYREALAKLPPDVGREAQPSTQGNAVPAGAVYDVHDPSTNHTQTFVSARDAGRAFQELEASGRPLATETKGNEARMVAQTSIEANEDRQVFHKSLPAGTATEDQEFRAGYLDSLEKDAGRRLAAVDWEQAKAKAPNGFSAPVLDEQLTVDMEMLARHRGMRAADLWESHAPKDAPKPYYADRLYHQQLADAKETSAALDRLEAADSPEKATAAVMAEKEKAERLAAQEAGQGGRLPAGPPSVPPAASNDAGQEPEPKARESSGADLQFDEASKKMLAARRAADHEAALAQLEENAIEQARVRDQAASRVQRQAPPRDGGDNEVQSDEVFHTAESDRKPVVPQDTMPPDLEKHFLKVGKNDYHFQKNPDAVAFSDRGNKLETKSNSAFVADTMVKIALARGWDEIKVTGSETFKREVWLEAASKGMSVKGYEPNDVDKARLDAITKRQALRGRETQNAVEQGEQKIAEKSKTREQLMAESFRNDKPDEAVKKYPELAGAYAGVEAQRRRVQAEHLTADQTKVALERINKNAANSIEKGKIPKVTVEIREQVETTEIRSTRTRHDNHRGMER